MRTKPSQYTRSGLEHGLVPPSATDLEEAVLGALMLENNAISDVMDIVRPESFYKPEHQKVFNAIVSLTEANNPVDILTVTAFLKQEGSLDLVGGAYFVSQLTERVLSSANAEFHARIIQQKFIARELIRVSGDIYHQAFEDTTDALDLLDEANLTIADIGSAVGTGVKTKSNQELALEVIADAERASQGGEIVGLPSPIPEKDKITGGKENGKLYITAARPAMGKSSDALQEAYHIAVVLGLPVAFFSIEMPARQLMRRLISLRTGIDSKKLKNGDLSKEEWVIIHESVQAISDSPLEIIDDLSDLMEIRRRCIQNKKKKGLRAIFIDYLQLVKHKESGRNREQEISEISRTLKEIAKMLDVPVTALSQLSRAVETRGGTKRPMLSDLRESGSIEQDADIVVFLYRPEYYGIEISEETNLPTEGLTEYIVAKNRDGSTGTVPMRFHPKTTSFSPWGEQSFSGPNPNDIPDTPRSAAMRPSKEFSIDDIDNDKEEDDNVF